MADIFDLYRNLFGGGQPQQGPPQTYDVGSDTIPLSLDRTPVNDPYTGTALHQLMGKLGDIGTAIPGLVERAQLGGMNALGMRQSDGDIYRSKLPVAPGIEALGDAGTFATGGLASGLAPAAGIYSQAARYGARAAMPVARDFLADQAGAVQLPRILRTLDTQKPPLNPEDWRGPLRGAGWWEPERGTITGTHVTDDPSVVTKMLQSGGPVTNRGADKFGDLGQGLYFSDSPQIWGSRSRSKWDFLDDLTKDQRDVLASTLTGEIDRLPKGYVTQAERDRALKSIDYFHTGKAPPQVLLNIADQPYNIDLANPDFLKRLGVTPSRQPVEAPIEVGGRFAQLDRNLYGNEADMLRDQGYQGAFTQGGFSTTPQFVTWDRDAVKSFNRAPTLLHGLLGAPY